MIAELLGRRSEDDARLVGQQGRKRIFATPWRFKRIAGVGFASLQIARFAGDAEFIFGPVVERLEVGISQGPVGER